MIVWSIGLIPVQEWIAEARRSRDLKIGSAVLSWLMATALEKLMGAGAVLLVPSLGRQEIDDAARQSPSDLLSAAYGIPNRASGCWSGESLIDLAGTLEGLQGIIDARWESLRDAIMPTISPDQLSPYLVSVINPVRMVWCTRPVSVGDPAHLTRDEKIAGLEEIEQLYQSVKRTRPIVHHHGAAVGKCGQCGKRDAAGPPEWSGWRSFQKTLEGIKEIREGRRLDAGERLCPVCLLKRFVGYLPRESFASTSEIAAREWLFRVMSFPDLLAMIEEWRRRAKEIDRDDPYPLLYERTIERQRKAATEETLKNQAVRVGEAVRKLTKEIESKHPDLPPRPSEYLAVVTFDGDDMGKAVQNDPEHIPPALLVFAKTLRENLQNAFKATPFYLGGDEGLLLCPIETCLALADGIRRIFADAMAEALPRKRHECPTISVGMAVFDRERPLAAAIRSARNALEMAKGLDTKNAMGVNVSTASGNSWTALDHWGEGWNRVLAAIELTRKGQLSSGWAYDVETLLETLPPSFFEQGETARNALRAEVRRITYRRTIPSQYAFDADDRPAAIAQEKAAVWEKLRGPSWWANAPDATQRDHVASQLHLIALLVRESQASGLDDERAPAEEEMAG